jgi:tetratricopeptide (TPR) repeat protein
MISLKIKKIIANTNPNYFIITFFIIIWSCDDSINKEQYIHQSFKDSLNFKNSESKFYFNEANKLKRNGDFNNAENYYKASLEYDSKNRIVLLNLGNLYWETKRLILAEKVYKEILDSFPNYFPALSNLSSLYNQSNDFDSSIKYGILATESAITDREKASCFISLSYAYSMIDSCKKAIEQFEYYEDLISPNDPVYDKDFKEFLSKKCVE